MRIHMHGHGQAQSSRLVAAVKMHQQKCKWALCVGWPNHATRTNHCVIRSVHSHISVSLSLSLSGWTRPLKISSKFIIYKWNYFMHICITTNGLLMRLKLNSKIVFNANAYITWCCVQQHKLLSHLLQYVRVRMHSIRIVCACVRVFFSTVLWLTIQCTLPGTCTFGFQHIV